MEKEYFTDSEGQTFYVDEHGRACFVTFILSPAPKNARPATREEIEKYENKKAEREKRQKEEAEKERKEAEALIPKYGFDPRTVGLRPRGFWEENDQLYIRARDGGGNEIDIGAFRVGNCVGTVEDDFDSTYRYYIYSPVTPERQGGVMQADITTQRAYNDEYESQLRITCDVAKEEVYFPIPEDLSDELLHRIIRAINRYRGGDEGFEKRS